MLAYVLRFQVFDKCCAVHLAAAAELRQLRRGAPRREHDEAVEPARVRAVRHHRAAERAGGLGGPLDDLACDEGLSKFVKSVTSERWKRLSWFADWIQRVQTLASKRV